MSKMKKTLFVVSDIHSFYSELKVALDKAGFNENNENHWLIVCGDAFDRGDESEKLLHFLMSLERKVLIRGNHDSLLEECCKRGFALYHDISNGTVKTIDDIGCDEDFEKCCKYTFMKTQAYRDALVNYFETENYIFVHSWIPTICEGVSKPWHRYGRVDRYNEDWRKASTGDWDSAMWGNPFELAELGLNKTGKTMVFGHWHCSTGWAKAENRSEFASDAKWDIYHDEINNTIGIDRCTAHTKEVNVLILEDNFLGE